MSALTPTLSRGRGRQLQGHTPAPKPPGARPRRPDMLRSVAIAETPERAALKIVASPRRESGDRVRRHMSTVKVEATFPMKAKPEQVWPFIADTDRLNRRLGLSGV